MRSAVCYSRRWRLLHVWIGATPTLGHKALDARLEHRQRHRAELEHRIVEGADIETLAERVLGARARRENGTLAEIVGQRLRRPGDVAIDFGADLTLGERRVLPQVIERLIARPALRVHAGIDDQARGAPDLVAEHAEAVVSSVVHPHLHAETLAIE